MEMNGFAIEAALLRWIECLPREARNARMKEERQEIRRVMAEMEKLLAFADVLSERKAAAEKAKGGE